MFSHGFGRLAPWLLGIALVISGFAVDATAARAGTLDASWTAPTTNADGSPLTDLASYRLYYGTSPSPCPGPSYVAVASSTPSPGPGETVMGTLTGLTAGTQYYASVTAVDTSGSESDCFTPAQTAVASIDFAVSPSSATSFGSVTVGGLVDQTFTVQNTAGGTISGTVATSAPFSVVSGSSFSLTGVGTTHVVTVRFSPTVAADASTNVTFTTTSGDTISRLVTGTGTATGTGDPTAPTVVITAPTTAATYSTTSAYVKLSGTAADNVGVSQVTWASSSGGSGTATGTTAWTAAGIPLRAGTNVLTVTARDDAGNTSTGTLTVTRTAETTPPTVSLTTPTSGATVSGTITVSANVTDNVSVAGVQFKLDGANLGTEVTAAPYTVSWNTTTAAAGAHSLTAVARDAAGNTATSTAVTVTVTVGSVSTPGLSNGSFETFTAGVATGWTLVTDGVVDVTALEDTGQTGFGQRIDIGTPGTWGFHLYQTPKFILTQTYEWTFSYKTSGANSVWAQVSDSDGNHVVVSQELAGTRGVWKQRTLTFTYGDADARMLRISSNAMGSIWLDAFSLREVDTPLLTNGSFEPFTGDVATGWDVATDGVVSATVARDTGQTGRAQKITITSPGVWGLYLHQQLVLKLNKSYEWTFSYKTSSTNAVWAQIGDAALDNVVLSQELPGTNGVWKQQTLMFTYTNAQADLLRISSNVVGSIWLDAFGLREVGTPIVSNGNFKFFNGTMATGWRVTKDGVVSATVAKGSGHTGYSQQVSITTPGVWGLYLYQQLVLKLDAHYEWTFFYKTSGTNAVWAQIADGPGNQLVLSQELPGTNGVWTQRTLTFTYTNARADLLGIRSNEVGTFWLDKVSVLEMAP